MHAVYFSVFSIANSIALSYLVFTKGTDELMPLGGIWQCRRIGINMPLKVVSMNSLVVFGKNSSYLILFYWLAKYGEFAKRACWKTKKS